MSKDSMVKSRFEVSPRDQIRFWEFHHIDVDIMRAIRAEFTK